MSCSSAASVDLGIVSMVHQAKGVCALKSGSSFGSWIYTLSLAALRSAMACATLVTSRCCPRVKVRQEYLAGARHRDQVQHATVA